jgi:hypothetical protein
MAQVVPITSEALQATIRRLLPSQNGFGEDLQASNVILPILDITPTAEGSQLPGYLQTAISVSGTTSFVVQNTTTVLASSPGFWIVKGTINVDNTNNGQIRIGTSATMNAAVTLLANSASKVLPFDLLVFLDTGDQIDATSNGNGAFIDGQYWQIADRYGNLNNPGGFTFE